MRFTGTLVRPLAEQGDRDGRFIDPDGVEFTEGRDYPLWVEFDTTRPIGYATVSREPDGSLSATGAITEGDVAAVFGAKPPNLAIGIYVEEDQRQISPQARPAPTLVRRSRLNAIALTGEHADPDQPAIEEIE